MTDAVAGDAEHRGHQRADIAERGEHREQQHRAGLDQHIPAENERLHLESPRGEQIGRPLETVIPDPERSERGRPRQIAQDTLSRFIAFHPARLFIVTLKRGYRAAVTRVNYDGVTARRERCRPTRTHPRHAALANGRPATIIRASRPAPEPRRKSMPHPPSDRQRCLRPGARRLRVIRGSGKGRACHAGLDVASALGSPALQAVDHSGTAHADR